MPKSTPKWETYIIFLTRVQKSLYYKKVCRPIYPQLTHQCLVNLMENTKIPLSATFINFAKKEKGVKKLFQPTIF